MSKLIVDKGAAAAFSFFGQPQSTSSNQLAYFQNQNTSLNEALRRQVIELNQAGLTCIAMPDKTWKAAFFDMDSTVIVQESIVELARAAGQEAAVHAMTEEAMAGRIDFETALRLRVALLKGLSTDEIVKVSQRLTINQGMREFSLKAKQQSLRLYLVSGGFHSLAQSIAEQLGFDGFVANQLRSEQGVLTGEIEGQLIDGKAKAQFLMETCAKFGWSPDDTVAIGDGANDLPMMQKAGAAIGYHPKPVLLPHINGANFHDHRVLVPLLLSC
ncbi:MAG: phosphoserine phosphatase SerB [Proteobacteria bacterium]|nr:phosphoserine phosphatase SerB [Pseudomonadota bacterium]